MAHYSRGKLGLPTGPVAGFSLTELLVSISIVIVILTVVILNQSTYTDSAALSSLADEISSTLSQAQAYGIGVREFSPGSNEFSASYGLTFSLLAAPDSGSASAYLYFADRDGDMIYDGDWSCLIGDASECLERVDISRGNYIDSICVVRTAGQSDSCQDIDRVDISFARPNTEAQVLFFRSNGQSFPPANIQGAKIILKSPGGLTKEIIVYNTGQISVQ